MGVEVRSLRQTQRNAQDGISMLGIAEGGLKTHADILIRIRELALQSASDTVGDLQRAMIHEESSKLLGELGRIAQTTDFQGIKLLASGPMVVEVQVGTKNDAEHGRVYYDVLSTKGTPERIGLKNVSLESKYMAREALAQIDEAINDVASIRSTIGGLQNRLEQVVNYAANAGANLSEAKSRISDADIAQETAELAKNTIKVNHGLALLGQANQNAALALKLLG